jgi:hypothetical protein
MLSIGRVVGGLSNKMLSMKSSDVWLRCWHPSPSQIGAEVAGKIKGFCL